MSTVNRLFILFFVFALLVIGILVTLSVLLVKFPVRVDSGADFKLLEGQAAVMDLDGKELKFHFSEMHPDAYVENWKTAYYLPHGVYASLSYKNNRYYATWRGTPDGDDSTLYQLDLETRGVTYERQTHELFPYSVHVSDMNFGSIRSARFELIKEDYTQISIGEPFTINKGETAILETASTGIVADLHERKVACDEEQCSWPVRFYSKGTQYPIRSETTALAERYVESDGLRLHLIDTDYSSYATLVLEKI